MSQNHAVHSVFISAVFSSSDNKFEASSFHFLGKAGEALTCDLSDCAFTNDDYPFARLSKFPSSGDCLENKMRAV